ncbi:autophagy ubiquitin-activating enzyme ApgG, putative [Talaromyces stipitatus ATCC 10500]|uniref:Ubiquitin-like modifier-activating enzyme ATG7 n=1 Tax=Talaromyces stipitatus (strain ATCC 10500 / CBS 375.48 / QM 6759 / NRRL 1006) TaxID=441959 RepID=B8LT96_TALSN|nr:autophagy ubiquitin-activating enzyme ApgG, putative [Talaromyces stipitatus ATCC 10500]EED23605.1 autophagy ubiquitin-activating enzyme ApgG, putative [Talaromyces stipitatus ATCC 10500]
MQYTPFVSDIELPFYTSLASQKINHDKLDDSARRVQGLYEVRPSDAPAASCRMQILGNALNSDHVPPGYYRAEGIIKNFNTVEEYRNADKIGILQQAGRAIWDAIGGSILSNPSILSSFLILSFADLKKYKFQYWFAFPAITSQPHWVPANGSSSSDNASAPSIPGSRRLSDAECSVLVDRVEAWKTQNDVRQHGFFLARKEHTNATSGGVAAPEWRVSSLAGYETGFFDGSEPEDQYFAFADPSNYPNAPGWMLRNLLALLHRRWGIQKAQILLYRDIPSKRELGRSLAVMLQLDTTQESKAANDLAFGEMPKITGWERNSSGKLAGRISDLTAYMDPRRLADQAVDLNLKLIKWRISPGLDLDKVKATSCLLLGAGTLGSYVARNLMGWGVRKITFVDNGSVSFSNPVRQPLFDFNDCLGGGAKKATRAAAALKEIYPGVVSEGHVFSVLMPGHPVTDVAQAANEFELLRKLIEEHDAIFLLMDSRESRWLPTVIGKSLGKIVMNAALGFDTFVAMRHGVKLQSAREAELGCYFCNDVVAPMDSMKDQTLDQQCTVTRPGVSAIASALLVELFVSILQHPDGAAAPAPITQNAERGDHPLGLVPHQIRGFLSTFSNIPVTGRSYDCCSACSDRIVDAYRKDGWDFVQKAINDKDYVEELSGLKEVEFDPVTGYFVPILTPPQVQRKAEENVAGIEWEDDSEGLIEE